MRDLVSFVLRGAWVGVVFSLALMIMVYGSLGAFTFLNPLFLFNSLPPGALVGFVLWLIAGRAENPLSAGPAIEIAEQEAGEARKRIGSFC